MQQRTVKLFLIFFIVATELYGQNTEIDRLIEGELKMTFPGVYFKHNSTDYAAMPYTIDSCFKHISFHFQEYINSLVIWRDTAETEGLTNKRIKKLKAGLRKYIRSGEIEIHSMGGEQKISRRTINMTSDYEKTSYLLSLNSVFDISKTSFSSEKREKNHIERPRIWCWNCWKSGFHMNKSGREIRKLARRRKKENK